MALWLDYLALYLVMLAVLYINICYKKHLSRGKHSFLFSFPKRTCLIQQVFIFMYSSTDSYTGLSPAPTKESNPLLKLSMSVVLAFFLQSKKKFDSKDLFQLLISFIFKIKWDNANSLSFTNSFYTWDTGLEKCLGPPPPHPTTHRVPPHINFPKRFFANTFFM